MSDNINGFPVPEKPETREEQYLSAIAQVTPATQIPPKPLTRVEAYLNKIVENGTGGGGGGTTNYNALENKPQINSHELSGNKSSADLGLQSTLTTAQQAAVDSGIDSAKVQQISTNETNILLKANSSDVNTATASLQAIGHYHSVVRRFRQGRWTVYQHIVKHFVHRRPFAIVILAVYLVGGHHTFE